MNRMHKALENLKLEGQKASRIQQSRQAVTPRVAAALRAKVAAANVLLEIPSPPSVLFSAPLLAGHEIDCLSIQQNESRPVEVSKRCNAPGAAGPMVAAISILGEDIAPTACPTDSPEESSPTVFTSLASNTTETISSELGVADDAIAASKALPVDAPILTAGEESQRQVSSGPVVVPADLLMNAIVLKRPTRTFHLERQPVARVVVAEPTAEPVPCETPPVAKEESEIAATEWERESARELADQVRYGQYAELLRCIRRDVRAAKAPVITYCSVEEDAQTADMLHRVATIASTRGKAKVLIVDADQQASRITDELNLGDEVGIVDALSHDVPGVALARPTSQAGIFVVPLGRGMVEHLGSARRRLASLVQRWKQDYSMVLIDVGAMSGPLASLISAGCDGAYVSVQLGTTLAVEAERRIKQFRTDGVKLLGCVALQAQ